MTDDTQSGATAQCDETADTEPCPPHSASDFRGPNDPAGYPTLDGHCALAAHNGQRVQYECSAGFVFVDGGETAT
jgi:hypothetical protein